MDVLDNSSQRETQTNGTLEQFGVREQDSDPDADKQKMEKFEIEIAKLKSFLLSGKFPVIIAQMATQFLAKFISV